MEEIRNSLIEAISDYQTAYPEEAPFKERFIELLKHPRAFFRDHLPGHITASSWIMDKSRQFTLLTHHKKLNRWLQPGGHADGDEDVTEVARREALEETGLHSLHLYRQEIFDLDIHGIPARNDFPAHDHYDIRFLFTADMSEPFVISGESHDLAWIPREQIASCTNHNVSILRMMEKVC